MTKEEQLEADLVKMERIFVCEKCAYSCCKGECLVDKFKAYLRELKDLREEVAYLDEINRQMTAKTMTPVVYDFENLMEHCTCGYPVDLLDNFCSNCGKYLEHDPEKHKKLKKLIQ